MVRADWSRMNKTTSADSLCFSNCLLPVSTFKLRTQEGVLKIKGDAFSSGRLFRHFRQAKHNPGVNFSKTELAFERQGIHGSMTV